MRITNVPIAMASLDVGHEGTFRQANGGLAAKPAIAWLDWKLKGDRRAAKWFVGKGCKLCKNATWAYQAKGLH